MNSKASEMWFVIKNENHDLWKLPSINENLVEVLRCILMRSCTKNVNFKIIECIHLP